MYYDDGDTEMFKGENYTLLKEAIASVKRTLPSDWKKTYDEKYACIGEFSHGIISWVIDRTAFSDEELEDISWENYPDDSEERFKEEITFSELEPVQALGSCLLDVDEDEAIGNGKLEDVLADFAVLMKENIRKNVS